MNTLHGLVLGLLATLCGTAAPAQVGYADKPIALVVGFPPGSQPDIVARLLGQKLSQALGQPVVVENIIGAAGNIAADRVVKAAPDGHTVGLLSQTHMVVNPTLYKLPFDPAKDLLPVSQIAVSPNVLVVSEAVRAKTVGELVLLARAQPGMLTFASSGSGSGTHMAAEMFKSATGLDIRHIPYKGVVAAIPDLLSGRVTMMFSPLPVVLALIREGKLRALAVTSLRRSPVVPDVPTVAESGYPRFEATNWYGLLVPARTSTALVDKLNRATVEALALPDLRGKFAELGLDVIGNSPAEFAAAIQVETPKWATVIRNSHIEPD